MGERIHNQLEQQAIGARIREARLAAGMSLKALSARVGPITFQQVQKYESGTDRVAASRLSAIADATGKPVTWFLGLDGSDGASRAPADEASMLCQEIPRLLPRLEAAGLRKTAKRMQGVLETLGMEYAALLKAR